MTQRGFKCHCGEKVTHVSVSTGNVTCEKHQQENAVSVMSPGVEPYIHKLVLEEKRVSRNIAKLDMKRERIDRKLRELEEAQRLMRGLKNILSSFY